jgi:hypothetical protein
MWGVCGVAFHSLPVVFGERTPSSRVIYLFCCPSTSLSRYIESSLGSKSPNSSICVFLVEPKHWKAMSRFEVPDFGTHLQGKVIVLTGMLCSVPKCTIFFRIKRTNTDLVAILPSLLSPLILTTNPPLNRRSPRHRLRTSPPTPLPRCPCLFRRCLDTPRRSPCCRTLCFCTTIKPTTKPTTNQILVYECTGSSCQFGVV